MEYPGDSTETAGERLARLFWEEYFAVRRRTGNENLSSVEVKKRNQLRSIWKSPEAYKAFPIVLGAASSGPGMQPLETVIKDAKEVANCTKTWDAWLLAMEPSKRSDAYGPWQVLWKATRE